MIEMMTLVLGIASKENVTNVVLDTAQKYIDDPSEYNWKKLVVSCMGLVLKDEQDQNGGGLEAVTEQWIFIYFVKRRWEVPWTPSW